MSNYLTDGRTALLDALKADAQISARVKTWFEFGAGLRRRFNIEPGACPLLALSPAEGDALRTANALTDVAQRLRIQVATDGQDAEPIEELVALTMECIKACDESCLDLADDGLTGVGVDGIAWRPEPDASGARVVWVARIGVLLLWKRT
jgi:hypothetical protein